MMTMSWVCSLLLAAAMGADVDVPQFRGPAGDGVFPDATGIPTKWDETSNITWKTEIPGRGWSSPVVGNGLIWLTTAVEEEATPQQAELARKTKLAGNPMAKQMSIVAAISLRAVALDLVSGKVVHNVELFRVPDPEPVHTLNSYASPSPILDQGRLYCHFGTFGTACVDTTNAKIIWKSKLPTEHSVGPGSSPVLYENRLIVPCDGTEAQTVVGLDIDNGKIAWSTKRPPMQGDVGDLHKAFSTPLLIRAGNREQAVVVGAQWVVSYNPADGKELWRFRHGEGFSNVPRPVFGHGLVYICTGYMQPNLIAIRPDGEGDVTDTHAVWRFKKSVPAMPSPVIVNDAIYMVSDQGVATCLDCLSGEQRWQRRIQGNYSASPVFADDKLLISSREGTTTILTPGREFAEIGTATLEGAIMASPVALPGALILRTPTHLYRIGAGK
jgi:outer membrane protein assembly factor BamB